MNEPSAASESRRLLMVDADSQLSRAWQRLLAEHHFEVSAVHSLAGAIEELERSTEEPPHFLFLDLDLPDADGLDLIPFVENLCPTTRIAVVTSRLDSASVLALFGRCEIIVPKPVVCSDVLRVLRILDMTSSHEKYVADFARRHRCSGRETQLLLAAVQGLNNDEAAALLGCDRSTVGTYWSRIFKKTATHSQRDVLGLMVRSSQPRSATFWKVVTTIAHLLCLLDDSGTQLDALSGIVAGVC